MSVSVFKTLVKAFPGGTFTDISALLGMIRAVKSGYEVGLIRKAGALHEMVYDAIPSLIREGRTEWELGAEIHKGMMALGYTGIMRFAAFGGEMFMGIVSSGESGNYPTASVGPGGLTGLSPAFPLLGGKRKLGRGEPIFVDTGFGYEGYFTDKTRLFSLGAPPAEALDAYTVCLNIQEAVRCRLKPGAIPSEIYEWKRRSGGTLASSPERIRIGNAISRWTRWRAWGVAPWRRWCELVIQLLATLPLTKPPE